MCNRQVISGFNGIIDINISSVIDVINMLEVENKEDVLTDVINVWRHIFNLEKEEKKISWKPQKNINKPKTFKSK